jgi:hypothetical protein
MKAFGSADSEAFLMDLTSVKTPIEWMAKVDKWIEKSRRD